MEVLYGALAGAVLVSIIAGIRHWFWCKREDRRFQVWLEISDWERDARLRVAGVSESVIEEIRAEIVKARERADIFGDI
jgi:hypothetical protein